MIYYIVETKTYLGGIVMFEKIKEVLTPDTVVSVAKYSAAVAAGAAAVIIGGMLFGGDIAVPTTNNTSSPAGDEDDRAH